MTISINGAGAFALVQQAVEGKEDFVYPEDFEGYRACKYEKNGAPSCLIGVALSIAGVTVEQLKEMDNLFVGDDTSIGVVELPDGLELTDGARRVFQAGQNTQDTGYTWGEARDEAEDVFAKLRFND